MSLPTGKNLCVLLFILIAFAAPSPGWSLASQLQVAPASVTHPTTGSPQSAFSLSEWNLPTPSGGPWGIAADQLGKIWFTENATNKLASYDPANNNFTEWSIPGGGSPRYVVAKQVIIGNSNVTRVYFTEYSSSKIAYFDSWNETFHEWQLPAGSNPVGIYVDSNYTIWFTESGRDAIGRLLPDTNQLTEWTLPGATTTPGTPILEPWGIYVQTALTGQFANITDRFVWFTELNNNAVGRLQITDNLLILWDLNSLNIIPGLRYSPMDIAVDSTKPGNVIFSAITGDRISVLQNCGTTACTGYVEYALPSRTSPAKPTSIDFDSSRNGVWFTEYNTGIIGYADRTSLGNPSTVPTSTPCVIPPTAGAACGFPSGSTTTTAARTSTSVLGVSSIGIPQPTATIPILQGPINGITEYKLRNVTALPNFVTLDYRGNVWFTESNVTVNRIGRLSIPYVFSVSVSPITQTLNQGQSASYGITVNLINGAALPVQLLSANVSSSLTVNFTPQSGTPPLTSTLTVGTTNSTPTGAYTIDVLAESGGQTESSTVTLIVQSPPPPKFDFAINIIGNGTMTIPQGGSASLHIELTTVSGSSENVSLNAGGFPALSSYSLTAPSGFPPFTTTLNIQTSIDTPPGLYPITISASSKGGVTHQLSPIPVLQVNEVLRDFSLTAPINKITLVQASRTDVTLTITSFGVFNGSVTLNAGFSPSVPGLIASFQPSAVILQPNGSAQVTMEIIATRSAPGQAYQLTVTGTSSAPSRTHQVTLTVQVSPCLIATAAFGSELSPEVQFLRTFRDQQILQTFAGSNFMIAFNAFYYSFSPTVAQFEYEHAAFRTTIRIGLYPLIGILHVSSLSYATLSWEPEIAVLAGGLTASFLIGLVYVALPFSCLLWVTKRRIRIGCREVLKWIGASLVPSMTAFIVAEAFAATWLMTIASSVIVLVGFESAIALGISIASRQVRRVP